MATWLLPRIELTPEQQLAVELSPDQHRLIVGYPGSGKTQVLIHRAAHLREKWASPPERFRIIIFTNVLKEYIKSGLKVLNLPVKSVCTFDSLCSDLYRERLLCWCT